MKNIAKGFAFIVIWLVAMTLVACDEKEFEKSHPEAVVIAKEAVELAEQIIEPLVDAELHVPVGTTAIAITTIEAKLAPVQPVQP